ncbi:Bax inhibitor-1/YccA family membrane protein [Nocardioides houyundeii]|uniref:Bax inhibitor-1/YccA family protein n=1 Tax=Nocardioides houyundeii TaxID=2045452 RepID=UPI000DF4446F|nr:Bax inhibitor-1/YccA family protein [Nocardioides houyundeii]
MKSTNPVFARSEEFNGQSNAYGNQTYPGYGQAPQGGQPAYGDPSTWGTGVSNMPDVAAPERRMTIDSVVQKTAISLAVVMATAFATWWYIGDVNEVTASRLYSALMIGSLGAFALSMVNSFKRVISPALVVAFAALEGVALGALSKYFDASFGDGIVTNAVFGTFAAFAGTLAAYKFFDIQVGDKFRRGVIAGMFGMVGLGLLSLVLSFAGIDLGFFGTGALGLLFAVVGLVLGVFMLMLDFDFVEKGVAAGLDERESWRAAFGLTVSLVWIYTNLLRILAIFSSD